MYYLKRNIYLREAVGTGALELRRVYYQTVNWVFAFYCKAIVGIVLVSIDKLLKITSALRQIAIRNNTPMRAGMHRLIILLSHAVSESTLGF